MRPTVGQLLIAIGVFHNVFGLVVGAEPLLAIAHDGFFATVPDDAPWRMAIFWFETFGFMLMLLGASWHRSERSEGGLPAWFPGTLVALGAFGTFFMPVSGFWLFFAVALVARQRTLPAPMAGA